jgi:hypothetical protein
MWRATLYPNPLRCVGPERATPSALYPLKHFPRTPSIRVHAAYIVVYE